MMPECPALCRYDNAVTGRWVSSPADESNRTDPICFSPTSTAPAANDRTFIQLVPIRPWLRVDESPDLVSPHDEIGAAVAQHHRGCIGVAGGDVGHGGQVADAQPADPTHAHA